MNHEYFVKQVTLEQKIQNFPVHEDINSKYDIRYSFFAGRRVVLEEVLRVRELHLYLD